MMPRVRELQALWNEVARPELPRWDDMDAEREEAAKQRLRERPDLSWWRRVIEKLNARAWYRGENPSNWRANPSWLLQPGKAAKALEWADEETPTGSALRCECCGSDESTAVAWGVRLCYGCLSVARPFAQSTEAILGWLRDQRNQEAVA